MPSVLRLLFIVLFLFEVPVLMQLFTGWNPTSSVGWFKTLNLDGGNQDVTSLPRYILRFLSNSTNEPSHPIHLVIVVLYSGFLIQLMVARLVGSCCPSNAGVLALNALTHAVEIPFFLTLATIEGIARMKASGAALPRYSSVALGSEPLSIDAVVGWGGSILEILYGFVVLPPGASPSDTSKGLVANTWDVPFDPKLHTMHVVVFVFVIMNPFIFAIASILAARTVRH